MHYLLFTIPLLFQTVLLAKSHPPLVSEDFKAVSRTMETVLETHPASKVLIVFDIDNTTLKTESDLASEHWYLWQKSLLSDGAKALPLVADSESGILKVQNALLTFAKMVPTAAELPPFLKALQSQGVSRIALTSRGMATRDATLREFEANQMPLSTARDLGLDSTDGAYLPYSLTELEKSGLTAKDAADFKLGNPRNSYFERGVFFTEGQHKGAMLVTLLKRMQRKFDAILFVDDREHHIQGMRLAFQDRREELYPIQFLAGKAWTEPFAKSAKLQVQEEWCRAASAIKDGGFAKGMFRTCE